VVEWQEIEQAIQLIESLEPGMANAFRSVGRSMYTAEVDTVTQLIIRSKMISEEDIMQRTWRDLDSRKFDNVIDTVKRTGKVILVYKNHLGVSGKWYYERAFYNECFKK
jgi:pyruvate/2-oxoglutarate/acetoin dehydrogenase E1 component